MADATAVGPPLTPSHFIIAPVLDDAEVDRIRAGLDKGMGGPLLAKWARQLLQDRDEDRRFRPRTNGTRPRWETVVVGVAGRKEPQELTQRLRVIGGWIYRSIVKGAEGKDYSVALCFVPEK
jgi:hypothetical protein